MTMTLTAFFGTFLARCRFPARVLTAALLAACSGSSGATDVAPVDAAGDSPIEGDTRPPDDGGSISPIGRAGSGLVQVVQVERPGFDPGEVRYDAQFTAEFTPAASTACTRSLAGPCVVVQCASGNVPMRASAGAVTFSGGTLAMPVTLTPDPSNEYNSQNSTPQRAFAPGDSLRVAAAGAEAGGVPSFGQLLRAPAPVTVQTPGLASGSPRPVVDRARSFAVAWQGGAAGDVVVVQINDSPVRSQVSCAFDAAAGAGEVPSAALAALNAGDGQLMISAAAQVVVDAGGWSVTIAAKSPAPDSDPLGRIEIR